MSNLLFHVEMRLVSLYYNDQNKKKQVLLLFLTLSLLSSSILRKNRVPFLLENVSNLTHEFLYDNFNKKILLNFLVKIVMQKLMCQI